MKIQQPYMLLDIATSLFVCVFLSHHSTLKSLRVGMRTCCQSST